MSNNTSQSNGIGFVGLLTIVFITLKLTGHIDWSWLWVLAPIWLSFAGVILILLVMLLLYIFTEKKRRY